MIDRYFQISRNKSTLPRETKAGITVFLTMSYILFIQPSLLSGKLLGFSTGMDFGALTTATCLITALGTLLLALYARFPISQSTGMGENFFFITTLIPIATAAGLANSWQVALGAVFFSGLLFFLLTLFNLTDKIIAILSPSTRYALVAGIGLFVTFLGLQNAGLIIKDPHVGIGLSNNLASPNILVFAFGLIFGGVLHVRKYQSYILWSIIGSFVLALLLYFGGFYMSNFTLPKTVMTLPPSISPLFLQMDLSSALSWEIIPLIFILLILSVFDCTGSLLAVGEHAGLMKNGRIPRAKQVLLSNSLATMGGACIGMSTIVNFIESITGVEQGGRTGFSSLIVAILFFLSLFFSPVIAMVASYPPITASALVLVGIAMMKWVTKIDWSDYTEAMPAFLVVIGIPFTFSIANGLGLGLICYPLVKIFSGRIKQLHWFNVVVGIIFLLYFLLIKV